MKKVFYETQKYGKLYIDKILFETYLPILFTCKNDMNDIFHREYLLFILNNKESK